MLMYTYMYSQRVPTSNLPLKDQIQKEIEAIITEERLLYTNLRTPQLDKYMEDVLELTQLTLQLAAKIAVLQAMQS
jgi:hypothetical protein